MEERSGCSCLNTDTEYQVESKCQKAVACAVVTGLRERRHRETKQLLVETAFDLFVERGFPNVSMEEVAQAAGVSLSTLYRRFPTKEDLVLEVPKRWMVVFDHAVEALPADASVADAIGDPIFALASHVDQHKDLVRTAYQILGQSPTLQESGLVTTVWLGRIGEIIKRFSTADDETSVVLAGAYFGAIDAMMLHWATTSATSPVTEQAIRLLARLAPILPPQQTGAPAGLGPARGHRSVVQPIAGA